MKTIFLTIMITGFLMLASNGTLAQTSDPTLNQVELMKQLLGTWKTEFDNGNSMILDFKPLGKSMEGHVKSITKDKVTDVITEIWGYDPEKDKIIVAEIFNFTPVMEIDVLWFSSTNTIEGVQLKDFAAPNAAALKYRIEIKHPDTFLMISIKDSVKSVLTWNRVKDEVN